MQSCIHVSHIKRASARTAGCEDCLKIGGHWVHLRLCVGCGHVGCCDSSPNRHASLHFAETGHPVIGSLEPGESWGYCFVDDVMVESLPEG